MDPLPRIAGRLFNAPLLVLPEAALAVAAALADRLGIEMGGLSAQGALRPRAFLDDDTDGGDGDAPYAIHDGVATIQVRGELINRGSWLSALCGLTSYEALTAALRMAAADPAVRGILLDVDSPGGEAAGAMETAAVVRDVSAQKPVVAFVDSLAASAGYAIAAGASEIVATPSSTLGSIGVVMLHLDRSAANQKAGVKPTLIHAGAYKVDGHSSQPLDDDARGRLQARIDGTYDLFVSSVAAHRPMTEAAVRATEAGVFMGASAVEAGLADRIGTRADALALFPPPDSGAAFDFSSLQGLNMSAPPETVSRAAHDSALASARADAHAEGVKAGAAGERTRVAAILGHAEAEGRDTLARHLAFETDMGVEAAAKMLKASAKEAPAAAPVQSRMDRVPNPAVMPDASGGPDPKADASAAWGSVMETVNREAARRL